MFVKVLIKSRNLKCTHLRCELETKTSKQKQKRIKKNPGKSGWNLNLWGHVVEFMKHHEKQLQASWVARVISHLTRSCSWCSNCSCRLMTSAKICSSSGVRWERSGEGGLTGGGLDGRCTMLPPSTCRQKNARDTKTTVALNQSDWPHGLGLRVGSKRIWRMMYELKWSIFQSLERKSENRRSYPTDFRVVLFLLFIFFALTLCSVFAKPFSFFLFDISPPKKHLDSRRVGLTRCFKNK